MFYNAINFIILTNIFLIVLFIFLCVCKFFCYIGFMYKIFYYSLSILSLAMLFILRLPFNNGLTHFWSFRDNQEKLNNRAIRQQLFLIICKI